MFVKIVRDGRRHLVECECDQCGKIYTKRYHCSYINVEKSTYCSKECYAKSKRVGGITYLKLKKTCLKKYGVEHLLQSSEIQKKCKETCLNRYGVAHSMQSSEIRDKSKETCLRKYGVEYSLQSDEVKEKSKLTCLKRHGVEHISQSKEVQKKCRDTCLKRYGVDHHMKSSLVKSKIDYTAAAKKRHAVMKEKGSYQESKIELKFHEALCEKFGSENVERQVRVHKWNIDFYVKPIDAYIQLDGVYWHGLDRPIDVVKEFKSPRDKIIYGTWMRDQEQNEWFSRNELSLIRVTDKKFETHGLTLVYNDLNKGKERGKGNGRN